MVDLCSIPLDASLRPLQFTCGSQTPTQCSFDARVDKPPKRSKMGGFPQKFQKRRIFRPFSHVFTGGQTWRFLCDFRMAIWRTK